VNQVRKVLVENKLTKDDFNMQQIRISFMAMIAVALSGCMSAKKSTLQHADSPEHSIDLKAADIVKDLDQGKLKIWYIAKGTRSEGLHGELEGVEVDSKTKGMQLESSIGTLTYHGEWNERDHSFSMSGWLPSDLIGIHPSWKHSPNGADLSH